MKKYTANTLYCIQRDLKRGNKLIDHLVANYGGAQFAYGPVVGGKVGEYSLVLLDKAAAAALVKLIDDCKAVAYGDQS